ncbi:MAG: hypothetical protein AB1345_10440 [Chloroflexota bacterium]
MNKRTLFTVTILMMIQMLSCQWVTNIFSVGEPISSTPTMTIPSPLSVTPTSLVALPPTVSIGQPERYAVILVKQDDVLNVRRGPGVDNPIVDRLDPLTRDIVQTGRREQMDDSLWVKIHIPSGGTGWVNAFFLTQYIPAEEFCADPRLPALVDRFVAAIKNQDGGALARLISPVHGLTIRHEWWNPEVTVRGEGSLSNLFVSPVSYDWGLQDGSGLPIQGTFAEVVLPKLLNVVTADYTVHCNTLEVGVASGGSAGIVAWPFEYTNVNYVALYRAAPADVEMDWRTWAVGIEYVNGEPFIAFLVQFHWEI